MMNTEVARIIRHAIRTARSKKPLLFQIYADQARRYWKGWRYRLWLRAERRTATRSMYRLWRQDNA